MIFHKTQKDIRKIKLEKGLSSRVLSYSYHMIFHKTHKDIRLIKLEKELSVHDCCTAPCSVEDISFILCFGHGQQSQIEQNFLQFDKQEITQKSCKAELLPRSFSVLENGVSVTRDIID